MCGCVCVCVCFDAIVQSIEITTTWRQPGVRRDASSHTATVATVRMRSIADIQTLFDLVPSSWFAVPNGGGVPLRKNLVVPLPSFFVSTAAPVPQQDIEAALLKYVRVCNCAFDCVFGVKQGRCRCVSSAVVARGSCWDCHRRLSVVLLCATIVLCGHGAVRSLRSLAKAMKDEVLVRFCGHPLAENGHVFQCLRASFLTTLGDITAAGPQGR